MYKVFLLVPAKDECVLNCRAAGMNFFATLNKTVIDGTPCLHPVASTGKAAAKGTRGICIDGYCKVSEFFLTALFDSSSRIMK